MKKLFEIGNVLPGLLSTMDLGYLLKPVGRSFQDRFTRPSIMIGLASDWDGDQGSEVNTGMYIEIYL